MSPEALSALVSTGAGGAVIVVVILFLKFIEKRDKETRDFFTAIRAADGEASKKLAEAIDRIAQRMESLEEKFDKHDATEMEFLRGVIANLNSDRKTQPRKAGA
jgi:hypothetical protein